MAFSQEQSVTAIEKIISYTFNDKTLLWEALHAAGTGWHLGQLTGRTMIEGNKRLAIVGDAYLRAALSSQWYATKEVIGSVSSKARQTVPLTFIGDWGAKSSPLLSDANLFNIAVETGIKSYIVPALAQGINGLGAKTVATTVEAIIGAVWEDCGKMDEITHVLASLGIRW